MICGSSKQTSVAEGSWGYSVYIGFILGQWKIKWKLLYYIGVILGLEWGNIGIMENKMETTTMENQMEKKMENEMETLGGWMSKLWSLFGYPKY